MKILDIDLDFFLSDRHTGDPKSRRLNSKNYKTWPIDSVIRFLENQCGLNKEKKVLGQVFTQHDEVFYFLKDLQERNNFSLTFSIDHVDAHADLGFGDSSFRYIATNVLAKSLEERAYPDTINGYLGAGNFLSFAIACRWVDSLNYITNINWVRDLPPFYFKDFDLSTNIIQLKQYSYNQLYPMPENVKNIPPISYEPEIPFSVIDYNDFSTTSKYDFVFLTQSPGYTPISSDSLIPVIMEYINIAID